MIGNSCRLFPYRCAVSLSRLPQLPDFLLQILNLISHLIEFFLEDSHLVLNIEMELPNYLKLIRLPLKE